MKHTIISVSLLITLALTQSAPAAEREEFLAWAQHSLVPADPAHLSKMIGNANVIALSEAVHGGAEPLEFRNRLFQYLVEVKGFTAIAIESGTVEGRLVYDYVSGKPGDLSDVVANGFSWTFNEYPQNRTLVQWMRAYNADPRHARKIHFYGFDVPGSPINGSANRGAETAIVEALRYLESVDSEAAKGLRQRVDPLLTTKWFDPRPSNHGPGYDTLSQADRDVLTAAIDDMIALLERREEHYTAVSSADDYKWGYRAAIGARQIDRWLRQIPMDWKRTDGSGNLLPTLHNVRDRAQADNVDWILKQEGESGKILLYASRYHISMTPFVSQSSREAGSNGTQQVAGTYLHRRLGSHLLTIGNFIGRGEIYFCSTRLKHTMEQASADSMDGVAGEIGAPQFLLDLRRAPADVKRWLDQKRKFGSASNGLEGAVGKAFDILLYFSTVGPACP